LGFKKICLFDAIAEEFDVVHGALQQLAVLQKERFPV
jgi:hypothetical protein